MMDKSKVLRLLPTGWREEADAMSSEQLKKVIIDSTANIAEIVKASEADEDLAQKKYAAKDAAAPYSDAKKAQAAKIAYSLHRLAEKGDPAGTGEVPETVAKAVENLSAAAKKAGGKVSVSIGGKKVADLTP